MRLIVPHPGHSEALKEIVHMEEIVFRRDSKELARKIVALIEDDNFREKILEYCNRLREERLWSNVGKKTWRLYEDILVRRLSGYEEKQIWRTQ